MECPLEHVSTVLGQTGQANSDCMHKLKMKFITSIYLSIYLSIHLSIHLSPFLLLGRNFENSNCIKCGLFSGMHTRLIGDNWILMSLIWSRDFREHLARNSVGDYSTDYPHCSTASCKNKEIDDNSPLCIFITWSFYKEVMRRFQVESSQTNWRKERHTVGGFVVFQWSLVSPCDNFFQRQTYVWYRRNNC